MIDTDKLDRTFRDALALPATADLEGISFAATPEWDSVGHLQLLAGIEAAFGITLDNEDVVAMGDYASVRRILDEKYDARE